MNGSEHHIDFLCSSHLVEIFNIQQPKCQDGVLLNKSGVGFHMELNSTLYLVVLAFVLMFLMNKLLFKPVLRTFVNRAKLLGELRESTARRREEMGELTRDYETKLAEVRAEVARVRAEGMRETQKEVGAILEQAHAEAQAAYQAALGDLQAQIDGARQELGSASQRLAEQTTNRILQA